jgi:cytidine deaminase
MSRIGETETKLLEAASQATENAHVLWGFKVGAAVLAEDGKVYAGCNVESWVSGLGTCAEKCAIDHAVLHGNRRIMEIAIVTNEEKPRKPIPCGACLQYIHDLAKNSKIKILMAQTERGKIAPETVEVKTLGELLPFPYEK